MPANAQLSEMQGRVRSHQKVATKDNKRQAKGLIEELESRVHLGPPIRDVELHSAHEFLRQHDFSPASDYFSRLEEIQTRLVTRLKEPQALREKRNYGGEAGGYQMQLQSIYDHLILSTCYEGDFNLKHGRVKISHRFNQEGRIDFVELKFLRSLEPCLTGEFRKLLTVKGYQSGRKDWFANEVFVLPVLPRELIFIHQDIFRNPRNEVLAWLVNIGHWMVDALLKDLKERNGHDASPPPIGDRGQLCLKAVRTDEVALPILQKAAALESAIELVDDKNVTVRYVRR